MIARAPCVSVCLPVYNGESYIRDAVDSVLQQSFTDFELIISDNASTDATAEICREVLARDNRVRYFRSDTNCGLAVNHNRAFTFGIGRWSMWFGHDDCLDKDYLSRCLEAMEQDPGLVLCFTNTRHLDENGNLTKQVSLENPAASGPPNQRFQNVLYQSPLDSMTYGLVKTDVLKQTLLHGRFEGSDRVLLAELALRGRFGLIQEHLYARRFHPAKTSLRYSDARERTLVFDPARAGTVFFPELLKAAAFFSAIRRAKLSRMERYRCYKHLLGWLWNLRRELCKDIGAGMRSIVRG